MVVLITPLIVQSVPLQLHSLLQPMKKVVSYYSHSLIINNYIEVIVIHIISEGAQ